jgi:hypothetical protein
MVSGMQYHRRHRTLAWKPIAAVLVLGSVISVIAMVALGSQVSGILSTVGASIGGPYGGQVDAGGGGSGAGSDGDPAAGSDSGTQGGSEPGAALAVQRDATYVIKTGTITVQVADVTPAVTTVTDRIGRLGGYASGSKQSGTGVDLSATVTFRIPSERWDDALNAVRTLPGLILDEETTTEDVTTKVVDLGARIRNLQVTERALQAIMGQATVIKDVLSVQGQLTETRGQIEQATAEQAHLQEQAAWSTLTATFLRTPPPAVAVQQAGFDPGREVDAATAKLLRGLQKVERATIWFTIVWLPFLVAFALAVALVFVVGRFLLRRAGMLATAATPIEGAASRE